jgi:hypothetical protein
MSDPLPAAGPRPGQPREAVKRWVGRHCSELPQPVSIIVGCDPRVVLGFKQPPPRGSGPAVGDLESQLPAQSNSGH